MLKIENFIFIFEKSLTIFYWNFEVWAVQKYANLVDRVKSFPTIANSNEYLLAKIGVDTAENEPLKVTCKQIYMYYM